MSKKVAIKAIVEKVISEGKHGPFVVATSDGFTGSITFSLEPTVWQEDECPEEGSVVYLTNLKKKRAGWRAKQGRYWLLSDEQTAEQEKVMKNLRVFVEELKKKFFPTEEDKAWKQWVDYKDRETKDLIELLSTDVKDSFKKRALYLLVVPSDDFNMLYWKKDIGGFHHGIEFMKTITPDQLSYVTDLIVRFCSTLRPMHCDKPKNVVKGDGSITLFMSIPDKYHSALYFYNTCILHLLTVLSEEKAEKIFPLFSLLDISTYCSMEDASGYNPFQSLLLNEKIDEKWKKKADVKMQAVIRDEVIGKVKPREKWEYALSQYTNIVQMQLYGEIKYSLELFTTQIQFIMNNCQHKNNLISSWHVIKLFNLLSGDSCKKLRHSIARYVLLEDSDKYSKFSIYGEETQQAVDWILEEFGNDQELVDKINKLIEEKKKKDTENVAYQTKQKTAEDNILAQMK
ncbi:MAG: hypothetical protein KAR54_00615 [Candidatus Pacebacteria bacterium]|nr:hypothetical protein [Candidatus Paceibacterota bacterium]